MFWDFSFVFFRVLALLVPLSRIVCRFDVDLGVFKVVSGLSVCLSESLRVGFRFWVFVEVMFESESGRGCPIVL